MVALDRSSYVVRDSLSMAAARMRNRLFELAEDDSSVKSVKSNAMHFARLLVAPARSDGNQQENAAAIVLIILEAHGHGLTI